MSGEYTWHKCAYCGKDKFCTAQTMRDHQEDCDQRPSKRGTMKICPKCGSVLTKVLPDSWLCVNESCDFVIGMLLGGKE